MIFSRSLCILVVFLWYLRGGQGQSAGEDDDCKTQSLYKSLAVNGCQPLCANMVQAQLVTYFAISERKIFSCLEKSQENCNPTKNAHHELHGKRNTAESSRNDNNASPDLLECDWVPTPKCLDSIMGEKGQCTIRWLSSKKTQELAENVVYGAFRCARRDHNYIPVKSQHLGRCGLRNATDKAQCEEDPDCLWCPLSEFFGDAHRSLCIPKESSAQPEKLTLCNLLNGVPQSQGSKGTGIFNYTFTQAMVNFSSGLFETSEDDDDGDEDEVADKAADKAPDKLVCVDGREQVVDEKSSALTVSPQSRLPIYNAEPEADDTNMVIAFLRSIFGKGVGRAVLLMPVFVLLFFIPFI